MLNALAAVQGGLQAREQAFQGQASEQYRNALSQYGMEAPQTRQAFAAVDPRGANSLIMQERQMTQQDRQFQQNFGLQEREFAAQQAERQERLRLARAGAARAAADAAARLTAQQAAEQAARVERALAMATAAETPEDWDRIMTGFGEEGAQYVGMFDRRDEIFAGYMGLTDALKAREGAAPNAREQKILDTMETYNVDRRTAVSLVDGHIEAATDAYGNPTAINLADRVTSGTQAQGAPEFTPSPVAPVDPGVNVPDAFGTFDQLGRLADRVTDTLIGARVAPSSSAATATINAFNEGVLSEVAAAYGNRPSNWIMQRISTLIPDPDAILGGEGAALDQYTALDNEIRSQVDVLTQSLQAPLRPVERVETENTINRLNGVRSRVQGIRQSLESARAPTGARRQGSSSRPGDNPVPPRPDDLDEADNWPSQADWDRMTPQMRALFQ